MKTRVKSIVRVQTLVCGPEIAQGCCGAKWNSKEWHGKALGKEHYLLFPQVLLSIDGSLYPYFLFVRITQVSNKKEKNDKRQIANKKKNDENDVPDEPNSCTRPLECWQLAIKRYLILILAAICYKGLKILSFYYLKILVCLTQLVNIQRISMLLEAPAEQTCNRKSKKSRD